MALANELEPSTMATDNLYDIVTLIQTDTTIDSGDTA
eukprot:COSAG01_NODE_67610_length_266_cov_1.095808_1_plen_36_part_10